MLAKFRSHLTYANVMVTALMFIVLGGGAYAAGTIGSGGVTNDSLRSVDLKDGAAVTSADVKDAPSGSDAIDADTVDGKQAAELKSARIRAGTGIPYTGELVPLLPGLAYIPQCTLDSTIEQMRVYFRTTDPDGTGNLMNGTANASIVASGVEGPGEEISSGYGPIYAENGASVKGLPFTSGTVVVVLPNDTGASQAETQLIIDVGARTYSIALHQYLRDSDDYCEAIGTATFGE